jgi:exosome complex exonuclease RRP6
MDIIWLQRDLGLYLVGLFDTHHAARALGYVQGSLAYLLKKFVDFDADKQYQMADWRIRPLPEEMFNYARSDTHYLLYCYDNLRNELIERSTGQVGQNRVDWVLQNSMETALKRYEREQPYDVENGWGSGGWRKLLSKSNSVSTKEQLAAFRAIHQWRDIVARQEDESTDFVMPNYVLNNVVRLMPPDTASLLRAAQNASPIARTKAEDLVRIINEAKENGPAGPSVDEILKKRKFKEHDGVSPKPTTIIEMPQQLDRQKPDAMRSRDSRFWGSSFGSSIWEADRSTINGEDLRLALPLPQLTAVVFDDPRDKALSTPSMINEEPGAVTSHQYENSQKSQSKGEDGVFIVKQLNGKRKRPSEVGEDAKVAKEGAEIQETIDGRLNELFIPSDAEARHDQDRARAFRKEHKAERKRLKAEKKALEETAAAGLGNGNDLAHDGVDGVDTQPFDYSKAESVLHRKKGKDPGRSGKKRKPDIFDPYLKSENAPKGMRRERKEKEGKSATFRQ